ncbi:hypothetical protein EDB85DRAFT_2273041 [Lactarius pseudohatsudake]|nr:hypothetical protein EDB85DRAFT_2273041 [Lactarius pseudohatsudake]
MAWLGTDYPCALIIEDVHTLRILGLLMGSGGHEGGAARQTRSHLNAAAYGHLWRINDGRISPRILFITAPTSIWLSRRGRKTEIILPGATRASPEPLHSPLASANVGARLARGPAASCASAQKATQTQTIPPPPPQLGQMCHAGDPQPQTARGDRVQEEPTRARRPSLRGLTRRRGSRDDRTRSREQQPGGDCERGPPRSGQGSQSHDDDLHHRMARLHLIATAATGHAPPTASGNSTAAAPRPRKLLLIGANPREEEPGAEKPQSSYLHGPENDEKGGADARKAAWEVLKRRVLDAEEHGGEPPLDIGGGGHDADRALRNIRARLRQGWAEEVMSMKAREESVKSTKKRRRDAGCWIRENGALLKCTVTSWRKVVRDKRLA